MATKRKEIKVDVGAKLVVDKGSTDQAGKDLAAAISRHLGKTIENSFANAISSGIEKQLAKSFQKAMEKGIQAALGGAQFQKMQESLIPRRSTVRRTRGSSLSDHIYNTAPPAVQAKMRQSGYQPPVSQADILAKKESDKATLRAQKAKEKADKEQIALWIKKGKALAKEAEKADKAQIAAWIREGKSLSKGANKIQKAMDKADKEQEATWIRKGKSLVKQANKIQRAMDKAEKDQIAAWIKEGKSLSKEANKIQKAMDKAEKDKEKRITNRLKNDINTLEKTYNQEQKDKTRAEKAARKKIEDAERARDARVLKILKQDIKGVEATYKEQEKARKEKEKRAKLEAKYASDPYSDPAAKKYRPKIEKVISSVPGKLGPAAASRFAKIGIDGPQVLSKKAQKALEEELARRARGGRLSPESQRQYDRLPDQFKKEKLPPISDRDIPQGLNPEQLSAHEALNRRVELRKQAEREAKRNASYRPSEVERIQNVIRASKELGPKAAVSSVKLLGRAYDRKASPEEIAQIKELIPQFEKATKSAHKFAEGLNGIDRVARKLLSLYIFQKFIQQFSVLNEYTLGFISELEQVRLGFAETLSVANRLFDKAGNELSTQQQVDISFAEADSTINKKLDNAIKYGIKIEALQEAFAVTAGSARSGGIGLSDSVDIITQLTVLAERLQIPINVVARDIRDIFTGLNVSRTILGNVLGLTQSQIVEWRRENKLAYELNDRLKLIRATMEENLNTFQGLQNSIQNIVKDLSRRVFLSVFEDAKGGLKDVQKALNALRTPKGVQEIKDTLSEIAQIATNIGLVLGTIAAGAGASWLVANPYVAVAAGAVTALTVAAPDVGSRIAEGFLDFIIQNSDGLLGKLAGRVKDATGLNAPYNSKRLGEEIQQAKDIYTGAGIGGSGQILKLTEKDYDTIQVGIGGGKTVSLREAIELQGKLASQEENEAYAKTPIGQQIVADVVLNNNRKLLDEIDADTDAFEKGKITADQYYQKKYDGYFYTVGSNGIQTSHKIKGKLADIKDELIRYGDASNFNYGEGARGNSRLRDLEQRQRRSLDRIDFINKTYNPEVAESTKQIREALLPELQESLKQAGYDLYTGFGAETLGDLNTQTQKAKESVRSSTAAEIEEKLRENRKLRREQDFGGIKADYTDAEKKVIALIEGRRKLLEEKIDTDARNKEYDIKIKNAERELLLTQSLLKIEKDRADQSKNASEYELKRSNIYGATLKQQIVLKKQILDQDLALLGVQGKSLDAREKANQDKAQASRDAINQLNQKIEQNPQDKARYDIEKNSQINKLKETEAESNNIEAEKIALQNQATEAQREYNLALEEATKSAIELNKSFQSIIENTLFAEGDIGDNFKQALRESTKENQQQAVKSVLDEVFSGYGGVGSSSGGQGGGVLQSLGRVFGGSSQGQGGSPNTSSSGGGIVNSIGSLFKKAQKAYQDYKSSGSIFARSGESPTAANATGSSAGTSGGFSLSSLFSGFGGGSGGSGDTGSGSPNMSMMGGGTGYGQGGISSSVAEGAGGGGGGGGGGGMSMMGGGGFSGGDAFSGGAGFGSGGGGAGGGGAGAGGQYASYLQTGINFYNEDRDIRRGQRRVDLEKGVLGEDRLKTNLKITQASIQNIISGTISGGVYGLIAAIIGAIVVRVLRNVYAPSGQDLTELGLKAIVRAADLPAQDIHAGRKRGEEAARQIGATDLTQERLAGTARAFRVAFPTIHGGGFKFRYVSAGLLSNAASLGLSEEDLRTSLDAITQTELGGGDFRKGILKIQSRRGRYVNDAESNRIPLFAEAIRAYSELPDSINATALAMELSTKRGGIAFERLKRILEGVEAVFEGIKSSAETFFDTGQATDTAANLAASISKAISTRLSERLSQDLAIGGLGTSIGILVNKIAEDILAGNVTAVNEGYIKLNQLTQQLANAESSKLGVAYAYNQRYLENNLAGGYSITKSNATTDYTIVPGAMNEPHIAVNHGREVVRSSQREDELKTMIQALLDGNSDNKNLNLNLYLEIDGKQVPVTLKSSSAKGINVPNGNLGIRN